MDAALGGARVVWRDAGLLVLDKPSGLPVLADRSGIPCLWDHLTAALAAEGRRPLQIHRIDKGTSGLLLVGLDPAVQRDLTQAFSGHRVHKWYSAVAAGVLGHRGTHRVDLPLTRGRKSRYRVGGLREAIEVRHGRRRTEYCLPKSARLTGKPLHESVTDLRCVRSDGTRSWFAVRPLSGRTHQIRVHMAWIGCPLLGDQLYGRADDPVQQAPRLALHCHRLLLPPAPGRPSTFTAPLPDDFRALLPD